MITYKLTTAYKLGYIVGQLVTNICLLVLFFYLIYRIIRWFFEYIRGNRKTYLCKISKNKPSENDLKDLSVWFQMGEDKDIPVKVWVAIDKRWVEYQRIMTIED